MILAFAHPGIVVPDLETAARFYSAMFGFRVVGEEGWQDNPAVDRAIGSSGSASRGLMLAGHNCFLELWEYSAPPQGPGHPGERGPQQLGIRHLAFYVDDCEREYQRLLALGGEALGQPVGGVVYARDPFGNILELCEIPATHEDPTSLPGVSSLGSYPRQET